MRWGRALQRLTVVHLEAISLQGALAHRLLKIWLLARRRTQPIRLHICEFWLIHVHRRGELCLVPDKPCAACRMRSTAPSAGALSAGNAIYGLPSSVAALLAPQVRTDRHCCFWPPCLLGRMYTCHVCFRRDSLKKSPVTSAPASAGVLQSTYHMAGEFAGAVPDAIHDVADLVARAAAACLLLRRQ